MHFDLHNGPFHRLLITNCKLFGIELNLLPSSSMTLYSSVIFKKVKFSAEEQIQSSGPNNIII